MKIYYVANARMPTEKAHGIQLAKMCEAFIMEGADLELVVPNRIGSGINLKEFYGLKTEIPVKRMPVLNLGFIVSSFTFALSYFIYLVRKKNAVLYTIDMDNFSFFLIPFLKKRYYSEIHDSKNRSFAWSIFMKKVSGLITINARIKENIAKNFNINNEKIIVKPNGIDLEMFSQKISKEEAREKLNLPLDKKIAVYVGREISWKGMEILSEAEKQLPSGTIYRVTDRPFQEIPLWLVSADLLVVLGTKKNDYSYLYTSPMKIFEYMASGRPILAANTPANRGILSDSEAIFYEPDNAKDFADKVNWILDHPEDVKSRTDNARKKVEEYEWSKRAKSILEMINK